MRSFDAVVTAVGYLHTCARPFRAASCGMTKGKPQTERSYAHRSLIDKLGVKPGMRACVRGIDDASFLRDLGERLGAPPGATLRGRYDAIFAGIEDVRDLVSIGPLRDHLHPDGMLWLIAPKGKGSPVPERELQAAILASGLVDVKVASFSGTHTAVKAVIRVAERAAHAAKASAART